MERSMKVAVRVRPLLESETAHTTESMIINPSTRSITCQLRHQNKQKVFKFEKVLNEETTQEDLYSECNISTIIEKMVQGFNATIFAYGQTGSGKTFTMEGKKQEEGVIQRSIRSLFDFLQNAEFSLYTSYIEIYNEKIYDLMNPVYNLMTKTVPGLRLRCRRDEFYVENLHLYPCFSQEDVLGYFRTGVKNKVLAGHNLNSASSRSHCILSMTLQVFDPETDGVITSRLQLVDLAGSERNSYTGNSGIRFKESIEINKALFALREVITALSSGKEAKHIPYRDSKLTSLLKQGIGGNSFSLMVACLTPSDLFLEENLSTLVYASKAGTISNIPVKNFDPKSQVIANLTSENRRLKAELRSATEQVNLLAKVLQVKPSDIDRLPLKSVQIKRVKRLKEKLDKTKMNFSEENFNIESPMEIVREMTEANAELEKEIAEMREVNNEQTSEMNLLKRENIELNSKLESMGDYLEDGKKWGVNDILKLEEEKKVLENEVFGIERERMVVETEEFAETAEEFHVEETRPKTEEKLSREEALGALSQILKKRATSRKIGSLLN